VCVSYLLSGVYYLNDSCYHRRLRLRKLYKCVVSLAVPSDRLREHTKVTEADILRLNVGHPVKLNEKDVIIHNMEINYGLKDRQNVAINPVDSCYFFEDWTSEEKFHIDKEEASCTIS
jgi:hypothetical protein